MSNYLNVQQLIQTYGFWGLILAMMLQTSFVPIPWEIAIVCATGLGMNIHLVIVCSVIGAMLGGLICFLIGRYAGLPVILKYGKYLGIRHGQILAMEKFSKKYGGYSVLLARVLPFVPYKIFSVAAGLIEIPLVQFMAFTILGLIPRFYLIALVGSGLHYLTL